MKQREVKVASDTLVSSGKVICMEKRKHHTEETKRKLSEKSKGKNNSFYGKCHTEESKKKMSEADDRTYYACISIFLLLL